MRFFKLFGRDRLVRIAAIVSLCGMLIFTTSSIQRRRISDALDKAAFEAALVNNCLDRASKLGGRTFEFKASRVNVSYAGWTDDESFDKESVVERNHIAVAIMSKLGRAGTLLDVGANVGAISFPTLSLPEMHTVVAVEPVGKNIDNLCMTANFNGWLGNARLHLFQAALSNTSGAVEIFIPEGREDNSAFNTNAATANVKAEKHGEIVKVLVGDELLEHGNFEPDVIKIDTQGHELYVLKGLQRYLRRARRGKVLVMAESDPRLMNPSGINPQDIYSLMVVELGYSAYCRPKLSVQNGDIRVEGKALTQKEYPPVGCMDIFYFKQPQ